MNSKDITNYMKIALYGFKRGEKSLIEIKHDSEIEDEPFKDMLKIPEYDPNIDI